jgi:hypothetical protein
MAKNEIRNGQAEYGTIHLDEERMRDAEQGVFEPHSSEAALRRRRKAEPAVANKDAGTAPANKSTAKKRAAK